MFLYVESPDPRGLIVAMFEPSQMSPDDAMLTDLRSTAGKEKVGGADPCSAI